MDTPIVAPSEIATGANAGISGDLITVRELSPSSLAVVADALAKNVALAFEEAEVGKVLEALEPFAPVQGSDRERSLRNLATLQSAPHKFAPTHYQHSKPAEAEA